MTKPDFYNNNTREQLFTTINELLQLNIIPIINTNDAVTLAFLTLSLQYR